MKIAQIAPLMESVPPRLYGGTERVVSYLSDELVRIAIDDSARCGTQVVFWRACPAGHRPQTISRRRRAWGFFRFSSACVSPSRQPCGRSFAPCDPFACPHL